jgi:hypothetical protein
MSTTKETTTLQRARGIRLPFPCGCQDEHSIRGVTAPEYTCDAHRAIDSALQQAIADERERAVRIINQFAICRDHDQPSHCIQCDLRHRTITAIRGSDNYDGAWQVIDSAPRDGTEVLIRFPDGAVVKARWEAVDYNEYSDRTSYDWTPVGAIYSDQPEQPTHWMPDAPIRHSETQEGS